jgi:hypothetical protein
LLAYKASTKNRDNTKEQQYRPTYEEDNRDGGGDEAVGLVLYLQKMIQCDIDVYNIQYILSIKASKRAKRPRYFFETATSTTSDTTVSMDARIHEGFI